MAFWISPYNCHNYNIIWLIVWTHAFITILVSHFDSYNSFDQGSSSTPIWAEDFRCFYSTTAGRYFCHYDGIGITDCTHSQDLAISCLAGKGWQYYYSFAVENNNGIMNRWCCETSHQQFCLPHQSWRFSWSSWNLLQWTVGNSLWQSVWPNRCKRCVPTTGVRECRGVWKCDKIRVSTASSGSF